NISRSVVTIRRLSSSLAQGYVLVAWAKRRFLVPIRATAALICSMVDMPVESMIGWPESRIDSSNSRSVNDADGTLMQGVRDFFQKSPGTGFHDATKRAICV